jgi:acyl-CoA thioesterase
MDAFSFASQVELIGPDVFRAEIPAGWEQGRGAFGGLVLGTLLRAIEEAASDPARPARVFSGDLLAPVVPGPVEVRVRRLREAKTQSNLAAEMLQAGEVVAVGHALLSLPRAAPARPITTEPPSPPAHGSVAVAPLEPPAAPAFTQHYEFRVLEPMPFSGATTAESAGWVRGRVTEPVDAPAIVALLDSHWPAAMALESGWRPMVTVSFTAEFLADPRSLDAAAPFFLRARAVAERDGFIVELRELWQDGRLVGMNQQTFAIVK